MALYVNGVNIKRVFANGVEIKHLYSNGVKVWSSRFVTNINVSVADIGFTGDLLNFRGYYKGQGGSVSPFQIETPNGNKEVTVVGTATPNLKSFWLYISDTTLSSVKVQLYGVWYNLYQTSDLGQWRSDDATLSQAFYDAVGQVMTINVEVS